MELGTVHAGHALHNEGFFSLGALMMLLLQLNNHIHVNFLIEKLFKLNWKFFE